MTYKKFNYYILFFGALFVSMFLLVDMLLIQTKAVRIINQIDTLKPDILIIGDSVIHASSQCEEDHEGIDKKLSDISGMSVLAATKPSFSALAYSEVLDVLIAQDYQPKQILIPINMRSFSDQWLTDPDFHFYLPRIRAKLRFGTATLDDVDNYFSYRFSHKLSKQKHIWLNEKVHYPGINLGVRKKLISDSYIPENIECTPHVKQKYTRQLRLQFQYHYMNVIQPDNMMLKALADVANKAKTHHIALQYYITPINIKEGTRLLGQVFEQRVRKNIAVLTHALQEEGIDFIDLSTTMESHVFVDQRGVCEHMNATGRMFVAQKLNQIISTNQHGY